MRNQREIERERSIEYWEIRNARENSHSFTTFLPVYGCAREKENGKERIRMLGCALSHTNGLLSHSAVQPISNKNHFRNGFINVLPRCSPFTKSA